MNETKEHILRTSLLLFLQKSYKDVTMKEIVEKTKLSKGAFYHYFASKEVLFREIAGMFFTMGVVDYSTFSNQSLKSFYTDYVNNIKISFQEMHSLVDSEEQSSISLNFFLIMFEAIGRFPEFLEIELEQYNQSVVAWQQAVKQAKETGEIKSISTDKEIADLFLYSTDGVFIRFVNSDKNSSYDADLFKAFNTIYNNLKT